MPFELKSMFGVADTLKDIDLMLSQLPNCVTKWTHYNSINTLNICINTHANGSRGFLRMFICLSVCLSAWYLNKLATYGTDGWLFTTNVSANFEVTWHKN